jgi:hypothetical protein
MSAPFDRFEMKAFKPLAGQPELPVATQEAAVSFRKKLTEERLALADHDAVREGRSPYH